MLKGGIDEEPEPVIREFPTLLYGLDEFKKWVIENDCHDVAMESTGVYWFPIYNVLESVFYEEGQVNIIVANPHHMKNVPGKKTDIKDAHWIATLLRAGGQDSWLQAIFRPKKSGNCVIGQDIGIS